MKYVLLFLLFGVALSNLSSEWDKFKRDYNKHYASTTEENERKQIFFENVKRIYSYQQTHPGATFTVGINHLTDRRIEELVSGPKIHFESRPTLLKSSIEVKNLPESLDWREKGVITPVIDQGELSVIQGPLVATAVVESLHAIYTNNLTEGSIPRIYDCCLQAEPDIFECIQKLGGICRKPDYPEIINKCEPNACNPFTTFDEIKKLKKGDENTMLTWIQDSTLWVVMNAFGKGFGDYVEGIYDEPTCAKTNGNHAMQIVGYGIEGGKPYWLCKNSWGEKWGEKGYIRMKRGENMCGIANEVVQVAYKKAIDTTELYTTSTTELYTTSATELYTNGTTQSHTTSATQLYTINPTFLIFLLMLTISQNIAVYF